MGYNIQQTNSNKLKGVQTTNPPMQVALSNGTAASDVKYIIAVSGTNIIKFGYCCELSGIAYPIFLKINGSYNNPFYVGNSGVYEMQPETFQDANDPDAEASTSDIIITEIMVPADIDFTLDYVTSTT